MIIPYLTPTEERVYAALREADGRLLTVSGIATAALGHDFNAIHLVRAHIMNLRRKLPAGAIQNVPGRGYRWTGGAHSVPVLSQARRNEQMSKALLKAQAQRQEQRQTARARG